MTAAAKERPILFSSPMVRAILEGRKTQTRRVVKPCKDKSFGCPLSQREIAGEINSGDYTNSFYGTPGERLWVRETFMHEPATYEWSASTSIPCVPASTVYRADFGEGAIEGGQWKPSIFMPRSLSRITLEITEVRVNRLQSISAKDILAEGAVDRPHVDQFGRNPVSAFDGKVYLDLQSLWAAGWNSINGKRHGCAWSDNPWVWCVSFKRMAA